MSAESESAPRPRRTWSQRMVLGLGVVMVMACSTGAVGVAYFNWNYARVTKYGLALAKASPGQPANFLVVGSDSRAAIARNDPNAGAFLDGPSGGRRSDTIMIVRVDPRSESATVLSLPRDLWVPIAGTHEMQRINAAYGFGQQVLTDTIEQYFGIPINHYVEVDFEGFQGLVNAIGGVPMYFERAMKDDNSGLNILHPGCITLDGSQALAFARSRHLQYILHGVWHTDPTGDLGRITRQQIFLRHAIARAVSKGLSNPLVLNQLVGVGVKNVGIDSGLSPNQLISLGQRFAHYNGSNLPTYSLPVTPFTTPAGAQVLQLDAQASVPVLDLFRTQKGAVPGGGTTSTSAPNGGLQLQVLNGSGVNKRAANVAGALERIGYPVQGTGNASTIGPAVVSHTEILYPASQGVAAALLDRHLAAGADLVVDGQLSSDRVVLVVGSDFTDVSAPQLAANPSEVAAGAASVTTTTPASSAPTTTVPIGRTPGQPPPGVSCG